MKKAEENCVCIDVYRIYEGDHNDELFECLIKFKKSKLSLKKNQLKVTQR